MGRTRDHLKKKGDIMGTFDAKWDKMNDISEELKRGRRD